MVTGRNDRYKLFWIGCDCGTGGVGIMVVEKWVEKVLEVRRVNARVTSLETAMVHEQCTRFAFFIF